MSVSDGGIGGRGGGNKEHAGACDEAGPAPTAAPSRTPQGAPTCSFSFGTAPLAAISARADSDSCHTCGGAQSETCSGKPRVLGEPALCEAAAACAV